MIRILLGLFLALHGVVHLLYFGHSAGYFELQPGMIWPDGSWVFSRVLGAATVRNVASLLLIVAAIGFMAGGIGILFHQTWWRAMVITTAIFSSIIYLLLWDASFKNLDNKGGIGILINLALLVMSTVLNVGAHF